MSDRAPEFPLWQHVRSGLLLVSVALVDGGTARGRDDGEVLAKVREAVGWKGAKALIIEGEAEAFASKGRFTLEAGPQGKFRDRTEAPLGGTVGDAGTVGWEVDSSGMPRRLEGQERDQRRLIAWLRTGQWLDPDVKLVATRKPNSTEGGDVVLEVGMADRPWRAELRLDGQSWLPRTLTHVGTTGADVVEFSRYIEHEGRKLAGTVTARTGEIPWFQGRVTAIRSAPADADRVFAPIERRPDDTRFDPSIPARVRLERARTGHLLVYPMINGVEFGAFVFDSGAAVTVIAPEVAAKLGLPTIGRAPLSSMFGPVAAKVDRAETLRLGPVTISGVNLVEMDLAPLNAAFGRRVHGVVGYDLFSRCVVDLILAEDALMLHDPKAGGLEGLRWLPLALPMRHPAVSARATGVPEGLFRLDLGAAGGPAGNVTFHGSAVKAYHLLDGRQVARVQAGNLHLGLGAIPWFELAGHRFERPPVIFALDDEGVLGAVDTLGNIGVEFLRPFRVVFDYPHSRIAFIERAGGPGDVGRPRLETEGRSR
jgi:hypothetical protein